MSVAPNVFYHVPGHGVAEDGMRAGAVTLSNLPLTIVERPAAHIISAISSHCTSDCLDCILLIVMAILSAPVKEPSLAAVDISATGQPLSGVGRYQSLDMWRGLACLAIVVLHSAFHLHNPIVQRLWLGVPVFFVISGYCITATAQSSIKRGVSVGDYFRRRFRRIFPPFWIAMAGAAIVCAAISMRFPGWLTRGHAVNAPWQLSLSQLAGNLTLTESWRYALTGGPKAFFLGQSWTLCYEEQFYAVVGLLLLCAPRRFFLGAAVLTVIVAVNTVVPGLPHLGVDGLFLDGGWLDFAAGILVFFALQHRLRRRAAFVVLAAGALLAGRPYHLLGHTEQTAQLSHVIAFAFAALLIWLHPLDDRLNRSKSLALFRWCGVMCYSLYLIHWPLAKVVSDGLYSIGLRSRDETLLIVIPTSITVSIGAAYLFHLAVERRFMSPVSRTRR